MESLRFAFISSHHPSEGGQGLAHVVSSLSQVLAGRGHQVTVLYPVYTRSKDAPREELWNGIRSVPVPWHRFGRLPFGRDIEFSWNAARRLDGDLDIVVVNNEHGGRFVVRRCETLRNGSKARRPVTLMVFHGVALRFLEMGRTDRPDRLRARLGYRADAVALRWLEGGAARRADACVACSRKVAHDVATLYGVPASRISVIYNGVDPTPERTPPEKKEAREELGIRDEEFCLSFLARDPRRKGFDVAVATVRLLRERGVPATLLNVGNTCPGSPEVRSLGSLDARGKRQALAASDVFFLPTWYEGLPLAIQEAAAMGIPVVTTPEANLEWGVAGRDYLVNSPNRPEVHAEALASLYREPERREAMGLRGRETLGVRPYSLQAQEYEELGRRILGAPRGRAAALFGSG